jgi:hypothetical protein
MPTCPPKGAPFMKLRVLIINDTGISWAQVHPLFLVCAMHTFLMPPRVASQICRLQHLLPAVEELHMMRCGITSLEEGASFVPSSTPMHS